MKFNKKNNGKYEMVPGPECLDLPDLDQVIRAFWKSGNIDTVTNSIYSGSNILFEKMTYDIENKEYELKGKFKEGSHMFWKVKADGNLFMILSGKNKAIGFLGPTIEINGKISSNDYVVDVIATKERDYFEITKFERNADIKMMDFFVDIENTVGGSSFTGSHSYMKAVTFDDLSWSSITGVGRYDKNEFEVVLQTKKAEYPQTKEKSDMYFIINGETIKLTSGSVRSGTAQSDVTSAKNFAFVGLFTGGEIKDTWNKVTTKELTDIEFKRVLDYKKWCLVVSSALFTTLYSYNILEPVRKYIKLENTLQLEFQEGTTFKVQADGVKAFCAKDKTNKGKIITGRIDQSGIYWEYPTNSMYMHLVDVQDCLKADNVKIVLPKGLSSSEEPSFYLEDIYSSGSYINIQIRMDDKDTKPFNHPIFKKLKFKSFVLNYAIDIGDKKKKWSLRMDLKTIFRGIPLHATVATHTDNWMFAISFPTTSVNEILVAYKFEQFSFEKGGNALTAPIKNCFLSISSGDETIFRITGLLGAVSLGLGDIYVEIMYVHEYGIAVGIKASNLDFAKFIKYVIGLDIYIMSWMSPFDLKLTASYMKKEVSHQLEDTDLNDLTVGKKGFSLNLVIEKTGMDHGENSHCKSSGICSVLLKYVFKKESSKITLSGSYMEQKLSLKASLTSLKIEISKYLFFSSIVAELFVKLDGSDMGILLHCTFNYYTDKKKNRKIELKGSLSASMGEVKLSFHLVGYIKEPLGLPFTIKDASIDASIDFSSLSFTLGIGGCLIFGKFEYIDEFHNPCTDKTIDTIICVDLHFGINPTNPLQSYISITSTDDLTIDNIAKIKDSKPPEFLLGKDYGFKGGFEFSISSREVTKLDGTIIREGIFFEGKSFKVFALQGQVKVEISKTKFEFTIELEPICWFDNFEIRESENSNKKKIYLGAKIEKGKVPEILIRGRLKLFGADIVGLDLKVDKNGLTIEQNIAGFTWEINFSLYETNVLSGKVTLTQRNLHESAKERNLKNLKKNQALKNQKPVKYLATKIINSKGKHKKEAKEEMIILMKWQIKRIKDNKPYRDSDRCKYDCAEECTQISISKEDLLCYKEEFGPLYYCLYVNCEYEYEQPMNLMTKTNDKFIRASKYKVMAELITTCLQQLLDKEETIDKKIKEQIETEEEEVTIKVEQNEVSAKGYFNGNSKVTVNMDYDYIYKKGSRETPGHKKVETVDLKEIVVNKRTIEEVIYTQILDDNEVIIETDEVDDESEAERLRVKIKTWLLEVDKFDPDRLKYVSRNINEYMTGKYPKLKDII